MTTTFSRTDSGQPEKPWYRHRWPWLIMSGPALVVVASLLSAWLAFTREDHMVADDYYNQGLIINQDLQRDARASGLALQFSAHYDAVTEQLQGVLSSHAAPLQGRIQLQLRHATDPAKDRTLPAEVDPRGAFAVRLPLLERSRWNLVVEDQRHSWRLAGVWQWPQHSDIGLRADPPAPSAP